jgi:hypothetical protein
MTVESYTSKFNRVIYNDGLSQVHFNTKTQTLALFDLHMKPTSIIGLTPISLRQLALHFLNAAHEIEESWK